MSIMLVIVGLALMVAAVFKVINVIKAILKAKGAEEPNENVIDANISEAHEEPEETVSTEVTIINE